MDELIKNLGTPSWWFSVVLVGILINLLSAYLKPRLDRYLDSVSRWHATRTEEKRRQRLTRIERLRASQHKQILASFAAVNRRVRALAFTILVLFFFPYFMTSKELGYGISVALGTLALVSILLAMAQLFDATRIEIEIEDANSQELPT